MFACLSRCGETLFLQMRGIERTCFFLVLNTAFTSSRPDSYRDHKFEVFVI